MKKYTQVRQNRPVSINLEKSKTDQSFKDDCDVNIVLKRFMKGGVSPFVKEGKGVFADVSQVNGLLEAHITLNNARDAFMLLPAEVRKKLGNNPLELENYLLDPANTEEAIELGLLEARAEYPPPSKPAVGEPEQVAPVPERQGEPDSKSNKQKK